MKPFHAHHPALCAGASLLAGEDGADCVFRTNPGHELPMGLFVGIRQAPTLPWRMLPLFATTPTVSGESFETLTPGRYGRTFALASDRWLIGPLVFKLCTPFWNTSDPAECGREVARLHFAPSIGGFVEYDNTHSDEPVEVIVGAGAPDAAFQPTADGFAGFTSACRVGFGTEKSLEVRTRLGDTPFAEGVAPTGDYAALVLTIPAATKRVFPFAIGFFNPDDATQLHRSLFENAEDVLACALANNREVIRRADELDAAWFGSPGTREEKVARAHAVRKHLAESRIKKAGSRWTRSGPKEEGLDAFDAEFFPWTGPSRSQEITP
ncbi:MAG TPA: glycoside hydrolase family 52 protein [Opitutaceae bacterium]|nr:glycoside hydrolase family 52 protein [Opitutaceae bacterium]